MSVASQEDGMHNLDEMRRAIDDLTARRDINEMLYRYARAIDRCDLELLKSTYWPDARDVHWIYNGTGYGFAEYIIPSLREIAGTQHSITNPIIEIDGDRAFVESQFYVIHHIQLTEREFLDQQVEGRYLDIFERREGVWKIGLRQAVRDQSREFVTTPILRHTGSDYADGQRFPADPVYLGFSLRDLFIEDAKLADNQWATARARLGYGFDG